MKKTAIEVLGQPLYLSATGKVRLGSRGTAVEASELYEALKLAKGEARKVRKLLRDEGYAALAGAPRSGIAS